MKFIDRFREMGGEAATDVVEAETAAVKSLWASRWVVWPALLLLIVLGAVGGFVAGHGMAARGVDRVQAENAKLASELKGALGDNAKLALDVEALKRRNAELTTKPLGFLSGPAAGAPAAAPVAAVSGPVSKPKVKVRKVVKPAKPVEGGWMGSLVKAVTGG